jgi:WD40 repeat protein
VVVLALLGVFILALLVVRYWPPMRGFILERLYPEPLTWTEVEEAPLTPPDEDPLPPGALVRLGRARLRQGHLPESLAFSPDGAMLASSERPLGSFPGPHVVHLWDTATGREVRRIETPHQLAVNRLAFSADGHLAALGDSGVCLWEAATGKEVRRLEAPWSPGPLSHYTLTPDGGTLVWMESDKPSAHVLDVATGRELRWIEALPHEQFIGFTPDGRTLVTTRDADKTTRGRDMATGAELWHLPTQGSAARMTAFSADGKVVVCAEYNGPAHVWDATTGQEMRRIPLPSTPEAHAAALSPDGRTLVEGVHGGRLAWWDAAGGHLAHTVHAHPWRVDRLAFSPDGKLLASASDGVLRLWDGATAAPRSPGEGHLAGIVGLAVAPDGKTVATAGLDETLRLWDAATGQELRRRRTNGHAVAFAPDGQTLALSGYSKDFPPLLVEAATGRKLRAYPGAKLYLVHGLAFSPDGTRLVAGGEGEATCLWNVADSKVLREFQGTAVWAAAFAPDGGTLAVSSGPTIELWDLAANQSLRRFGPAVRVPGFAALAFSPDGRRLAAAEGETLVSHGRSRGPTNGAVRVFDVATGAELLVLSGHRGAVSSIQFTPDGRLLVSGGEDGTVRLWDAADGKERHRFEGHRGAVTAVACAPDGRTLISGSQDTTALVWDLTPFARP